SPEKGDAIGFLPHGTSLKRMKTLPKTIKLIDVRRPPREVLREIGSCRLVLSESLHGLIAADAFEIPNIWVVPNPEMIGGTFKFNDYFSALDAPKASHPFSQDLLANPPRSAASVGRYKGNKSE